MEESNGGHEEQPNDVHDRASPSSRVPLKRISSAQALLRRKLSIRTSKLPSFRKSRSGGGEAKDEFSGPTFPQFNLLSDDLAVVVLSFVAYAPFEEIDNGDGSDHRRLYDEYIESMSAEGRKPIKFDPFRPALEYRAALRLGSGNPSRLDPSSFGTLTHVLPLVSRQFRDYSISSDTLWSDATERIVLSSSDWRGAVGQLGCRQRTAGEFIEAGATKVDGNTDSAKINELDSILGCCDVPSEKRRRASGDLVALARLKFVPEKSKEHAPGPTDITSASLRINSESSARQFFVHVASDAQHFLFSAPLFFLGGSPPPSPGEQIRLHLFEPRYKLLIEEVMKGRSARDKSGHPLSERGVPRPRFIYVSGLSSPMVPGDPALIVEVAKCKIHHDGRANVTLVSTRRGTLSTMEQRPNSFRLIDATIKTEPRRVRERNARGGVGDPQSTFHGPVFIMRSGDDPTLGCELGLHIFEPRYRLLVREATEKLPATHKGGRPIPITAGTEGVTQRPRFLWAFGAVGLSIGAPAVLVEIRRCRIMTNGMADITVVPIKHARVTQFAERPDSGGLFDAQIDLSA